MKLPLLTAETMSIQGQDLLDKVKDDFIDKLPSEQEYYQNFEKVINKCLK